MGRIPFTSITDNSLVLYEFLTCTENTFIPYLDEVSSYPVSWHLFFLINFSGLNGHHIVVTGFSRLGSFRRDLAVTFHCYFSGYECRKTNVCRLPYRCLCWEHIRTHKNPGLSTDDFGPEALKLDG